MADNATVMIWITRADGSCTYLNKRWQEFTGQTADRGLAAGWLDTLHPDDRARVREEFSQAQEERAPIQLEYRVRRDDGVYRWTIDSATPRMSNGGEFLGYIGSVLDISARREAEDERQKSLDRLCALHEINLAITSEMDLQNCLDVLLEQIEKFFPHQIVSPVRLLRPETGQLPYLASRGNDKNEWLRRATRPDPRPRSSGGRNQSAGYRGRSAKRTEPRRRSGVGAAWARVLCRDAADCARSGARRVGRLYQGGAQVRGGGNRVSQLRRRSGSDCNSQCPTLRTS